MRYQVENEIDQIHNSAKISGMSSIAQFEILETYEQNIDYYRENGFSYIPLPYSEQYYDIEEGSLYRLTSEMVGSTSMNIEECLNNLIEQEFVFYDSHGKAVVDQPEGHSLPYKYESGKVEIGGKVHGPRQAYENYHTLKEQATSEEKDQLYNLAREADRYRIVTLADTNVRRVRSLIYRLIMRLETRFSEIVEREYDSEELLEKVNPTAIGEWKKAHMNGESLHLVNFTQLGELKHIISESDGLYNECGFTSPDEFNGSLSGLTKVRNKVMHPTSTLIRNRDDLREVVGTIEQVSTILSEMKNREQSLPPYWEDSQDVLKENLESVGVDTSDMGFDSG